MSTDSKADSKGNSQPWHDWPFELPSANELRDTPDFKTVLNDDKFHREMAQEQRDRVFAAFKGEAGAAVLLKGGTSADFELYDQDVDKCEFRQESFFRYLFTINEPDSYALLDLEKKESWLFVADIPDDAERWNGDRRPPQYYTERYGVTKTFVVSQLAKEVNARNFSKFYVLKGTNLDSGNACKTTFNPSEIKDLKPAATIDDSTLWRTLTELRLIKTEREIQLMRLGNRVSSAAHVYVMRHIKAGMTEMHCEALFKAWCHYHGAARHMAYVCICGTGGNGAILHYGHAGRPNDRILADGDRIVLDMGADYAGYATDITRSYPINGKFTDDQKAIHNAVFAAQSAVMKSMKPGTSWPEMHRLAEKVIIEHLVKIGILQGSVDEMMAEFMGAVFMPHGLGHLLGMNVHDVGGYPEMLKKSQEPGLKWLRCGLKLEAGMVITVEPGIYFNDGVLNAALRNPKQAKFINVDVLARFRGTGGVRIEDDVLVTKDGCENLTVLPTSVEEIEEVFRRARADAPKTAAASTAAVVVAAPASASAAGHSHHHGGHDSHHAHAHDHHHHHRD